MLQLLHYHSPRRISYDLLLQAYISHSALSPQLQPAATCMLGLPFGLFMTVVGGGELFTGNTAVVTAAAIEGKASIRGLLKNWIFSYLGNFVGCVQPCPKFAITFCAEVLQERSFHHIQPMRVWGMGTMFVLRTGRSFTNTSF